MKPINGNVVIKNAVILYKKYFLELFIAGITTFIFSLPLFVMVYGIYNTMNIIILILLVIYNFTLQSFAMMVIKAVIVWFINKKEQGVSITLLEALKQSSGQFIPLIKNTFFIITASFYIPFRNNLNRGFRGTSFRIATSQSFYFVLFENLKPKEAMEESYSITKGNVLKIYLLDFLTIPLYIVIVMLFLNVPIFKNFLLIFIFGFIWYAFFSPFAYAFDYSLWKALKKENQII